MKKVSTRNLVIIVGGLIILLLGGIGWQIHENSPQVQAEKAAKAADAARAKAKANLIAKLKHAPEGHYIHISKNSDTLYLTTRTAVQLSYEAGGRGDGTINGESPYDTKRNFGTKHTWYGSDELIKVRNGYDSSYEVHAYDPTRDGNHHFFFKSRQAAGNDPDVIANVKHIVY